VADGDGQVVRWDPPQVFELTWGTDVLRFELEPDDGATTLTMLVTFDEQGRAARDAAGWHVCLETLERHLAGVPATEDGFARCREVHERYVDRLGPEASIIGPPDGHPASDG
jgi:Activator of Hsp90 ATPase homolog 1-like protein